MEAQKTQIVKQSWTKGALRDGGGEVSQYKMWSYTADLL